MQFKLFRNSGADEFLGSQTQKPRRLLLVHGRFVIASPVSRRNDHEIPKNFLAELLT